MSKPHILVIDIEDACCANYTIECPNEADGAERECASWTEKNWPDPISCQCAEIGDGTQCEECADGDHDGCCWGSDIEEIGPSCRAQRENKCWYQHALKEGGQEMLEFGRNKFSLRIPVKLKGHSWDEPIEVTKIEYALGDPDAPPEFLVASWKEMAFRDEGEGASMLHIPRHVLRPLVALAAKALE